MTARVGPPCRYCHHLLLAKKKKRPWQIRSELRQHSFVVVIVNRDDCHTAKKGWHFFGLVLD